MVKAYILIGIEGRDPRAIASELTSIPEIENVHMIFGEYDLITFVDTKSLIHLREITLDKISKIHGVITTSSIIVADEE